MLQCVSWCLDSLSQILDGPFKTPLRKLLNNGFFRLVKFCCRTFPHDLTLKHQTQSFGLQIETKAHTLATDIRLQDLWNCLCGLQSMHTHQSSCRYLSHFIKAKTSHAPQCYWISLLYSFLHSEINRTCMHEPTGLPHVGRWAYLQLSWWCYADVWPQCNWRCLHCCCPCPSGFAVT